MILASLIRLYFRSGVRGSTRLTFFLAQHVKSLQRVPLDIPGWAPVYIDLRLSNAHDLLIESPYTGLWRELDEVRIMKALVRPGSVVFDVGANVGLHSILLSSLIGPEGRLCVFEPNSKLLPALKLTIGQFSNAVLYPFALSNKNSKSALYVPSDDTVASLADWTVASPVFSGDGRAKVVNCDERRLDDLVGEGSLPYPDFIKCDVEGAEHLVFEGARQTLDCANAPIILFEANECASQAFNQDAFSAQKLLTSFERARYSFFEIQKGGQIVPLTNSQSTFLNILAVPESRASEVLLNPIFRPITEEPGQN